MSKLLAIVTNDEVNTLAAGHQTTPEVITGECRKCGKCCVWWNCPLVDPITHHCQIYNNRPIVCRMFPQRQADIDAVACDSYRQTGL